MSGPSSSCTCCSGIQAVLEESAVTWDRLTLAGALVLGVWVIAWS